jgi:signal transduction histidine kinase
MSLRIRLTLLATLLPAAALLGFGLVVYIVTANNRYSGVDEVLETRAHEVRFFLRGSFGRVPEQVLNAETLTDFDPDEFSTTGVYIAILDGENRMVTRSQNLGGQSLPPLPMDTLAEAFNDEGQPEGIASTYEIGGERVRVFHEPLGLPGDITGSVIIGRSLTALDRSLADLRNVMVLGGAGALVVIATLGYVFTGRGLRPLQAVSDTAREISETGDFSRRIVVGGHATETERLAHTFNDMIGTVQRTFEAQREFLADSSHELRRPLTILRGNIDLLANPGLDEEGRRESLEEMRSEAERMRMLISDLLLLARVERKQALEPASLDFGRLVSDVIRRRRDPEPHAELRCEVDEPLPLEGDEGRLRQMVSNLVDNAMRYTEPGGHVEVRASRENGHVRLDVTDTGIGIGHEDLPHVFDRFFRTPTAQEHSDQGAGLGLAIVKYIAEAHGGNVSAESTPGRGSRFTVELPAPAEALPG